MTRLEKVIKDKKEELKKLLLEDYCPRDFGIEDRHNRLVKYCDPATRNCEACWNEEAEKKSGPHKPLKGGNLLALRAESIPESVRPIRVRACAWCEKDEMLIPLQDCMGCSHNRQDGMKVLCSWAPAEKPCEG